MIFTDDSVSGSWDSSDSNADQAELRARFGRNFAWFRQSGAEYVITDSGVLKELDQAMEPQREVNRMQDRVNQLQADVNAPQADINRLQDEVNAMQQKVNRRQDLANRIQASVNSGTNDELVKELEIAIQQLRSSGDVHQESVNRKQAEVNEQQARVNARQNDVNGEQQKVNALQQKVNNAFRDRIQQIFDSAIRRRLVQRLM
jgi:chromosome segregation ATPase